MGVTEREAVVDEEGETALHAGDGQWRVSRMR